MFGPQFNQPVDFLPDTITHATFGRQFNQLIDHLPTNLKYLKLGAQFDQAIDHLPPSLETLHLQIFLKPVDNLPSGLKELTAKGICQPVDHLPNGHSVLSLWLRPTLGSPSCFPHPLISLGRPQHSLWTSPWRDACIQTNRNFRGGGPFSMQHYWVGTLRKLRLSHWPPSFSIEMPHCWKRFCTACWSSPPFIDNITAWTQV